MADQYHIDSNIVTTSDSIEPMAGLVVNTTMTDNQSVISNVTTGGVGAKGDKGEQGIPGATGTTGPKGDKGADSTVPGPQGPQGPQGVQGTAGSNGTNGAKGDKGDTGATGLKGDKGDTGLTGAAGTNGQGVPTGGTTGQQLAKINGTDYNTQWVNPVDISGKADTTTLTAHTSNTSNPHSVTKAQVGLGSVPNTDFTSAIAVKQDTLVSGTSIKTVNSTSLLGSGDIVIGGAVDSVNTQTGAVVLDTDDIAEGTNKYVTSAEKTKLSNTSGVNTGDQDISGIATNASNITGKVSKSGDTMTGGLYFGAGSAQVVDSTGKNLRLGYPSNVGPTFELYSNDHATRGGEFAAIYGAGGVNLRYYNGSSWPVKFGLDGSGNTTISGVLNSNDLLSNTAMTYSVGSSSNYWLNTYTQKLYLNSTAYLDGSTAGQINLTGNLALSGARMTLAIYNDTDYSDGLSIYKSGSAGVLGGAVKDGGEVGFHSFYAFDGTSDKRVAFVLVGADGDTTPTTGGGRYDIYVRNSAGTQVLPLSLTGANAEYQVNPIARTSLTYNLGSTARYWLNTYTQKLYLNSTAYLDGSTAGQINLTGNLALSGADTTVSLTGVTTEPSAPSTGQLKIYSKEIAGKMFPKTVGPSGIDSPLQNAFWQNNICIWQPTTASNGLWLGTAPASAGTYATVLPTSTSLYTAMKRGRWSNIATTANQVLTQRSLELMYFLGNSAGMGGFFFYTRMGFDTWTDGGRLFAGLFNGNSLIQSDPSTVNNNIGFAVDVADNGLIYFQTKGTGAAVRTSTGFTITSGSGYDMYIFAAPNSTTVSWRILEINTGTEATGSSAVSGPAVDVMMMAGIQASNAALTSVNAIQLCINRIYVETDR